MPLEQPLAVAHALLTFDTVGEVGALLGDKAIDSHEFIADLIQRVAKVVISQHPRRSKPIAIDLEMYKWRHLIETSSPNSTSSNASPYAPAKTDQSFEAMIYRAAAVINSR